MSADPSANLQVFSPPGSGRSSPIPRATRNAAENSLHKKDKGFRRYAAGVERALALWDTAQQEWADYISFLGRLLKALQAHPSEIPVVPHSDTVALRLAQCLNPALPSGVHQKALEVYAYIFATIGKDALARDLSIYFPGLASVPSFASLSVRPLFLTIFESHILRLDATALRPALKAIILSLLPGLEDETSEDFERMFAALDKLRRAIEGPQEASGSSHFWQCFFLAAITNASRRQGALAFLIRRLPKFGLSQRRASDAAGASTHGLSAEAEAAICPEPGLLIRCFESGLSDPQLLIQRGFLDLLVSHLPLDSPVLQDRIGNEDLERLVTAAAGVVSRRDMSLNRRLWAWFLGPEPSASASHDDPASPDDDTHKDTLDPSTQHAAFFSQYGLEALTNSVLRMINKPAKTPTERARPFRVCLSLMDRWEVGGLIVPEIFLPALQSVQQYSESASAEQAAEVLRSASAFFDGVDSGLIWGKLIHLLTSALKSDVSRAEALSRMRLTKFVLVRFNLKEEDMLLQHMPLMVFSTLASLNAAYEGTDRPNLDPTLIDLAFEITESLVQMIPERALQSQNDVTRLRPNGFGVSREVSIKRLRAFYEESQGSLDATDPPFGPAELGQLSLREAVRTFMASLQAGTTSSSPDVSARILASLIFKTQDLSSLEEEEMFTMFQRMLALSADDGKQLSYGQLNAISTVLVALQTALPSAPHLPRAQVPELVHPLVSQFWRYLSPTRPKFHVETTRCILQLHAIAPQSRMVEAAVASIIEAQLAQTPAIGASSNCGHHFATLWTHTMHELNVQSEKRGSVARRPSGHVVQAPTLPPAEYHMILTRPILLLLDTLDEDGLQTSAFMRSWLQDLPTLGKIFDILAHHIQSLQCIVRADSLPSTQASPDRHVIPQRDDSKECLYYMRHIYNIVKKPSQFTWITLAESPAASVDGLPPRAPLQEWIVRTSLQTMNLHVGGVDNGDKSSLPELHGISVSIISQIYQSPFSAALRQLELEVPLMERLRTASSPLETLLLEATMLALKLRLTQPPKERTPEPKSALQPSHRSRLSLALNRDSEDDEPASIQPPPQLIDCLKYGFSSPSSRLILDDWVNFLTEVLPLFADTIFQNLLPLVECLCKEITSCFAQLKSTFAVQVPSPDTSPESTLISLINGLEQILAKAHDRLTIQESKISATKSPEQPQGFFSNVVSGVFSSETQQTRTPTANSRLTVLLCFQDTVRICFAIWSWGGFTQRQDQHDASSAASFGFTSLRMRNRARRILEHLFAAEALECLETLAVLWSKATAGDDQGTAVLGLLNVLNGSKPKHTIPAIFNAVYSRTDPSALEPNRASTLTSDLSDAELVAFLVEYTKSLEDDAMDEIWQDCTLFLRDVLANPLPHRQILPMLLEFTAVIGQKVDNTNFGEQRKMRRDLADIFSRILTAIFTTRSMGYVQDPQQGPADEKPSTRTNGVLAQKRAPDVVAILTPIAPKLPIILLENDRVAKTVSDMSSSIIGPSFRAKSFPDNMSKSFLDLLQSLMKVAQNNKLLKKDISDAFNDSKFFSTSPLLLKESWLPILAQWTQSDKERVPELLARMAAPTTAGIMFGVGAASARQEADRKTQLNLRRIALLVLASPDDAFTSNLPQILEKVVELLAATPATSPSSATRADALVLLRAIILRTSHIHLASLWPVVNGELTSALSSLLPDANNKEHYNNASVIQACKLLDQLVVLDPDDFQLSEWLFISDTIDAVYKPASPSLHLSLTDEINEVLSHSSATVPLPTQTHDATSEPKRTLFLDPLIEALEKEEDAAVLDMARSELINRVVRPFLGNLSMNAFEARYGGGDADWDGIWESVVRDAGS
ncbi:Dopey, N-terminal-domain-containing protein [Paraphoma chrysanthemicola]|uniref:Dopey, N-terminal-domain-containing protein n=1 Tax=Paraphoma chrysanthemicola TaxID=798071 RepID=A0A8K0RHP0_9PLEO|nr:Dopey, N-terminal-domain-containing protein [Paraphoma chrysanthemicola]